MTAFDPKEWTHLLVRDYDVSSAFLCGWRPGHTKWHVFLYMPTEPSQVANVCPECAKQYERRLGGKGA